MGRIYRGALPAIAFALALLPIPSRAAIRFCNDYSRTIYVAVAYQDTWGIWQARGWLELTPKQCSAFANPELHVSTFSFHAESEVFRDQGQEVSQFWGKSSAPDKQLAVTNNAFLWSDADRPKAGAARMVGFIASGISTSDKSELTIDVTVHLEPNGSSTVELGG
jgi:Protein of unknown function (DUF1036)